MLELCIEPTLPPSPASQMSESELQDDAQFAPLLFLDLIKGPWSVKLVTQVTKTYFKKVTFILEESKLAVRICRAPESWLLCHCSPWHVCTADTGDMCPGQCSICCIRDGPLLAALWSHTVVEELDSQGGRGSFLESLSHPQRRTRAI